MRHERLHLAYTNKEIDGKCIFRYYLQKTSMQRTQLVSILKGETENKLSCKIPTRLGNIRPGAAVLADRGFGYDFLKYPNCNQMLTSHFLLGRKQFTKNENSTDKITCKLRYTCEVVYSRVTDTKSLQGVITYDMFPYLQHCHNWAHARCNLQRPLRIPMDYDA